MPKTSKIHHFHRSFFQLFSENIHDREAGDSATAAAVTDTATEAAAAAMAEAEAGGGRCHERLQCSNLELSIDGSIESIEGCRDTGGALKQPSKSSRQRH